MAPAPAIPLTAEQEDVIRLIRLPPGMKTDEDIGGLYRYFNKFDFLKDQRDQQSDKDKKNKLKAGNAQRQ